ncbi:MAG: hypothetical protein AAFN74_12160 [Myxococcota bacterium]
MADQHADTGPVTGVPRLPPGRSVESSIRRDRDGRWYHDGQLVDHEGVRRSFDAWIERHENGRYVVKNNVNWAFVEIEGAPVFVRTLRIHPDGLALLLSDGRTERLRSDTLRQDAEGRLYCQVRFDRLTAEFSRRATLELEPIVEETDTGIALRIAGHLVTPPITDRPVR